MAVTQTQYTGNGNTVLYSFTFPYLATTDVKVKINGVTQATTEYSLANATTVQMNTAPANGANVLIFRDTDNDNKKATFYPGSAIKAEDLNDNIDQVLYVAQEVDNNSMSTLGDDAMQGDLSLGSNKVTNLGNPVSGTDAVNKNTLTSTIDTAIESDVLVGTDLSKSASGGQVTINHNVSGANTTINNSGGNVVQDITISAQGHVTSAGSVNLDNRYYTETELNAGQLDNRYFTETELSGGQLNNLYYTETELDGGQLDNRYFTETELNNGALDTRYFTEAELNNGQLDTRYFRQDSSETITSGATWSGSDNFIATTAAIDARIVDLVDDVGGFVPIANETSFPATNPDVNNGTGTLVSIKSISSARTPSGGSVVITDGAGSGNDVTITGLGTTVLPAGYGVIVETTGTTHTYTFHRLSPDATSVTAVSAIPNEIATVAGISSHVQTVSGINNDVQVVSANNSNVTTVAGSISSVNTAASNLDQIQNFANVYRIVSSDPTTSLNAGDLIFNTTTNKFRVYTGAAWVDAVARQFSDNTKMQFGNSNDLEIYHNGSDSYIRNDTGNLFFMAGGGTAYLQAVDNENGVKVYPNGKVELFYDNSPKLETTSTGVTISGNLVVNDITLHTGNAQQIIRDWNATTDSVIGGLLSGSNFGTIHETSLNGHHVIGLRGNDTSDSFAIISGGGNYNTDTTYDKLIARFYTDGVFYMPDNNRIKLGTGNDLQIYHNGSTSYITDSGTGSLVINSIDGNIHLRVNDNEEGVKINENGAVQLYYDGSPKFETKSWGAEVDSSSFTTLSVRSTDNDAILQLVANNDDATEWTIRNDYSSSNDLDIRFNNSSKLTLSSGGNLTIVGNLDASDNNKILLGNDDELQIYHDGTKNYIDGFAVEQTVIRAHDFYVKDLGTGFGATERDMIVAKQSGSVELYHNNVERIRTTSLGANIYGHTYIHSNSDGNSDIWIHGDDTSSGSHKLKLGISADLQLYHDGNHSRILEAGTGKLQLGSDTEVEILNGSFNESMAKFQPNGAVFLYYDNSPKFQTTSNGWRSDDNVRGLFGDSGDLEIFHDGNNSLIYQGGEGNLSIQATSGEVQLSKGGTFEHMIRAIVDGSVKLYHDGTEALTTTADGIQAMTNAGEGSIYIKGGEGGSSALYLHADQGDDNNDQYRIIASDNDSIFFQNYASGNWENSLKATGNGSTILYYDNGPKLETLSTGVKIDDDLHFPDQGYIRYGTSDSSWITGEDGASGYLKFGVNNLQMTVNRNGTINIPDNNQFTCGGENDLKIYHNATNSYIENDTGNLFIQGGGGHCYLQAVDNENGVKVYPNAQVELYYDGGSPALATTSYGAKITGQLSLDVPSDYWGQASTYIPVSNLGALGSHGGYEFTLTAGGYRRGNSQWHDYTINSQSGYAAQVAVSGMNGNVTFRTQSGKSTGDSSAITTRLTIDSNGLIKVPDFVSGNTSKLVFGTGYDLQIYHDGSNSYIDCPSSGVGHLIVKADDFWVKGSNNEGMIQAQENGTVALYYNNSQKVQTTATGFSLNNNILSWNEGGDISDTSATNVDHIWHDDGANAFYFVSDGSVKQTIGTSKLVCNSVVFGSNDPAAAANRLDDYEEGTHTPTFANLEVPANVTTDHFHYTKIGRLVHFNCKFTVSSSINDVSGFGFTLPFTQAGLREIVVAAMSDRSGSEKEPFVGRLHSGQSTIYLYEQTGGSHAQYNDFGGNKIWVSGTYEST